MANNEALSVQASHGYRTVEGVEHLETQRLYVATLDMYAQALANLGENHPENSEISSRVIFPKASRLLLVARLVDKMDSLVSKY